ncbi:MAG TPA: Ig-like domain-containing protein [Noviherbaspirillum sp.]|nr:Ig-like domain-containing protein [Noviherbaspirillum sp.]
MALDMKRITHPALPSHLLDRTHVRAPLAALVAAAALLIAGCGAGDAAVTGDDNESAIIPLSLVSATLENASTAVPRTAIPQLVFTTDLDPGTVNGANVKLTHAHGSAPLSFAVDGKQLTVVPVDGLLPLTRYSLQVESQVGGKRGQKLASGAVLTFTTADASWKQSEAIASDMSIAFSPAIAAGPAGSATAFWVEHVAPNSYLWSRRYTPASGWEAQQKIQTDPVGIPHSVQLAFDADGNGLAVWPQTSTGNDNIWASRYTQAAGWSAAQLIETNDAGSAEKPRLVMNPDGVAMAIWMQWDGSRNRVWSNRFTPEGGWEGARTIDEGWGGNAIDTAIAMDRSGNALAFWYHYTGQTLELWTARYEQGMGWGTPGPFDVGHDPHPVMLEDGTAMVAWGHYDGSYHVRYRRYTPITGWGAPATITTSGQVLTAPRLAVDASANASLVWTRGQSSHYRVWSSQITSDGQWTQPDLIDADPATGAYARLRSFTKDASGNALALWSESLGGNSVTWVNRYTAASGWSTAQVISASNEGMAFEATMAMGISGGIFAIWSQYDGTKYAIMSRRFD